MRSPAELKAEWIKHSGWNWSAEQLWLRTKIAHLFDLKSPNESQAHLLRMADLRLTLMDLPGGANPTHESELVALALAEFGPPPRWWQLFFQWSGALDRLIPDGLNSWIRKLRS